jgi:hypothetical protein
LYNEELGVAAGLWLPPLLLVFALELTSPLCLPRCFVVAVDGHPRLLLVLLTAMDIASAMVHMHCENIIHGDLKARNILLKTSATDARGFTAKVADFGLSMQVDPNDTHVSEVRV